MKQTKHFRRLMSILLIVTMLLSMAVVGAVGVSAQEAFSLTYDFKYQNAGYAEGQIRLTANSEEGYGAYVLYWADDTKALEGYAPIATVNLNQDRKNVTFKENTAIPAGATKVIAVDKATTQATVAGAKAVYDIPTEKQFKYAPSEVAYNFQTLSDIHIDGGSFYKYSEAHLLNAMNVAQARGAEFVSSCGDQTNNGSESEWGIYLKTIAKSDFTGPVFEVTGNHIDYTDNEDINSAYHKAQLDRFRVATGLGVETDKLQNETYYEVTAPNGDHHLYMSLECVNHKPYDPANSNNFSDAQMDWLEGRLEAFKGDGKKVFIYEHAPFNGYGAGDNKETPYYGAAMVISSDFPNVVRFKELLEANKDVVLFTGHTHIDFKYNYNLDNENGTTAHIVHVPSTASTTVVNADKTGLDYPQTADSSQGYFVDVYADATVLNGTDLVKNEILPLYTYLINYTGEELAVNPDYVEESDVPFSGETVDIYFTNNMNWESVYVYAFNGEIGQPAESEPLGEKGAKMELVGKNIFGQDVYTVAVPSNVDYIKFMAHDAANNRTDNIPNAEFEDNTGFYLEVMGSKYWPYKTYIFDGVDNATAPTTEPYTGATATVYAINSLKWDKVGAHYWDSPSTEWPGVPMTKTGETVNGFDVYSITINGTPANIIFNDNVSGSGKQTDDLVLEPGKYFDIKAGKWYGSLADVPAVSELSTDRFLLGGFNGWSTTANEFMRKNAGDDTGYVELELEANTTYEFKIIRDGAWTSCKDTLSITDSRTGLTFSSSVNDNTKITTKEAGTYVFTFGVSNSQLAVYYPGTPAPVSASIEALDPVETVAVVAEPEVSEVAEVAVAEPEIAEVAETKTEVVYGDADLNGKLSVKDGTAIQKHIAGMLILSDEAIKISDVDANEKINVKDGTMIQKRVAELIDIFPIEEINRIDTEVLETAKTVLEEDMGYASYVAYANLKKVYFEYKDAELNKEAATAISEALATFEAMKENNPDHIELSSAVYIHGDFSGGWADHKFKSSGDGSDLLTLTIDIAQGSYAFVIHKTGPEEWLKNSTAINDTCTNRKYTTSGNDTVFTATGGTYTFTFDPNTSMLSVTKN